MAKQLTFDDYLDVKKEKKKVKVNSNKYYSGSKLLNCKDLDGKKPEIFVCIGNRTAGKTFYFKNMLLKRFFKYGDKFVDLVRYKYEVQDRISAFYKDLVEIKYPDLEYKCKSIMSGAGIVHILNGKEAGYTVSISSDETIKKYSSMFVDVKFIFFDEFASTFSKYAPQEVTKFQSIHTSMARGGGEQSRYLPCILCANQVSILNPYYTAWGINNLVRPDTKFLKRRGLVLEQTLNVSAKEAMLESAFSKAFVNSNYFDHAADNISLTDNFNFVENYTTSSSIYAATIEYDSKRYAVWVDFKNDICYVNRKVDKNRAVFVFKKEDHDINKMMLDRFNDMIERWRSAFLSGCFRFSDLEAKEVFVDILAIR